MTRKWGFYGRREERAGLDAMLGRGRWFFAEITGRRRIGKTALIQQALRQRHGLIQAVYVQIPDSDERGVTEVFRDALEDFDPSFAAELHSLHDLAQVIERLCRAGVIVVLDEFQYFHRKTLVAFLSHLQARVDALRDTAAGGLIVLGSIHTEMTAILEDRASPLFNRVTDRLRLDHWDFATLFEVFAEHGVHDPGHMLFLWNLFEGVPKFYRDAHDHQQLAPSAEYRKDTVQRLFFEGSSPLRDEADNWFLRELRGRYDTVLKFIANNGPCAHGDIVAPYREAGEQKQIGGYLQALIERYSMVERRLPVFAPDKARRARYALADNFLAAWLAGLGRQVRNARIQPLAVCLERADTALATREGIAFEKMIRLLLEECSRKQRGEIALTDLVRGYWNQSGGIEIDIVALDENARVLRLGSCKRQATSHRTSQFRLLCDEFMNTQDGRRFADWHVEHCLFSPFFQPEIKDRFTQEGFRCLDLLDFQHLLQPVT